MLNMANIWDKFDEEFDVEGLKDEVKDAAKGKGGDFKEVPLGEYEVKVDKMELTKSKAGDPMVTIWFKIVEGKFKNSLIFYNQIIPQGFQLHLANELLRSLDSGLKVEFETFKQYGNLILDIGEEIDGRLEYELEYGENKKGYNTYKIKDVFELE